MIAFALAAAALAADSGYQQPPADIAAILDAPRPPAVLFNPDHTWMVELARPELPSIAELAAPRLELAGLEIDPATRGPARAYAYTGLVLRPVGRHDKVARRAVEIGDAPRIRDVIWDRSGRRLAFTSTTPAGIELWTVDVERFEPRRLLGPVLNAASGPPCDWLPADEGLVCKVVPAELGPAPEAGAVPTGPRIEESLGRKAPGRTWQDLLTGPHDEALFEHYLASDVVRVALDGEVDRIRGSGLVDEVTPSPDGRWVLVEAMHPPWSTSVPAERFPRTFEALPVGGGDRTVLLADLPLADDVPIPFGSVRTGRRAMGWRADRPATVWWVEALDGGDAGAEAEWRDALSVLDAPFDGEPARLWRGALRFAGVDWGSDDLALVQEWWWKTRTVRTWQIAPSDPGAEPALHWERSYQDRYADPGAPLTRPGPYGVDVLSRTASGALLLSGAGYGPDGVHPFLDRYDLRSRQSQRLWRSEDPWHEALVDVLDPEGSRLVTRRQSAAEPPDYFVRRPRKRRPDLQLTATADWAPPFAAVTKEVVHYQRADGVPLTATLYLPPGYRPERDGPLPTLFWAYPNEFKRRDDAGQTTANPNLFDRPGGPSHLFFLLAGYAVVDDPTLPIVGEGETEPNDTFVEQLVAGATAAVETFVARGVTDPERTVVGGHSYGAFMAANLLAHSDLFRAGIARSGAYNRTLTPFGFQGEERTFWEAPEVYLEMSPFSVADQIDEPLLMIHGADDSNPGTWPVQSARLYEAIKGLGGTVRWVELPLEDHGYRARESVGHALYEMLAWADRYAKESSGRSASDTAKAAP